MAKCPVCQADILDDFGLVTCNACGSQVLLDVEEPPPVDSAKLASNNNIVMESFSDTAPELVAAPEIEPTKVETMIEEIPHAQDAVQTYQATSTEMSDVVAYGNSEISQASEGFLKFDIFIIGIDTVDLRQKLKEVLEDSKFLWDAELLVSKIHQGQMSLKDLSAIKAALLVQRLRSLPVDIRWEQHAIHSS